MFNSFRPNSAFGVLILGKGWVLVFAKDLSIIHIFSRKDDPVHSSWIEVRPKANSFGCHYLTRNGQAEWSSPRYTLREPCATRRFGGLCNLNICHSCTILAVLRCLAVEEIMGGVKIVMKLRWGDMDVIINISCRPTARRA